VGGRAAGTEFDNFTSRIGIGIETGGNTVHIRPKTYPQIFFKHREKKGDGEPAASGVKESRKGRRAGLGKMAQKGNLAQSQQRLKSMVTRFGWKGGRNGRLVWQLGKTK